MSINQRLRVTIVAAFVVLAVSGCATVVEPATEAAQPSPTAPATPAPAGEVATLLFSGSGSTTLDADGGTVGEAPFAQGVDETVRFVTEAVGAPPTITENEAECAAASTSYQWEGVVVTAWTGSADFILSFSAPTSGGVRLETTGGFAPGDDVSAFIATLPEASVGRLGASDIVAAFDVVSTTTDGDYTSPVGALGYVPGGVILQSVTTPGEWSSFFC